MTCDREDYHRCVVGSKSILWWDWGILVSSVSPLQRLEVESFALCESQNLAGQVA